VVAVTRAPMAQAAEGVRKDSRPQADDMKIAVTGRGGVGKTTLASLLACTFARQGCAVLAVDADPAPCLGVALGFPPEILRGLFPIAAMKELIAERTGARPGDYGSYFKLNPHVSDIPDRFSATHRGIRLLQLGALEKGGAGCICPESALLKALVSHILVERNEVVVLDLYAGVEHLGRATAEAVDAMLIVAEPTERSLATAAQIRDLARDIHLDERLFLVGSKIADEADRSFIEQRSPGLATLGHLPLDSRVREADRTGRPVYDLSPTLVAETQRIVSALKHQLGVECASREDKMPAG
jgi:CO dehydrogenase maturation factor